ncbi:hypothetical protein I317_03671 [Kwoniella heveanensis CBS 569]|uniref:Ubiquitin-like domain-containing protein n=1 Tax=Kwoniella heveanensis BCC8398 TaxID=1296120 RepID=A0A1B9GIC8_9TREE|nr:hypothetical protein I316_07543 [Kwoniella heveanensis BCC8398]OCF42555.1 hypothetical protein I317_03671 [Kwoniella heveanensis CBS 569]
MSDQPLSGDRLNEERAFIKRYTEGLSSHKVEYPADFSTPLEDRPRKVAVVGVDVAEPPNVESMDVDSGAQDNTVQLTIKSLRPSLTITLSAQLTDTVSDLKSAIASSSSNAPSADTQRLLLKGKALTDTKLLKEYDITSGATLHLMVKAAAPASVSTTDTRATETGLTSDEATFPPPSSASPAPPALTITTSLDSSSTAGTSMPLSVLDSAAPPTGPQPQVSSATFHTTVADPAFWQKIHALCVSEFAYEEEADSAWETFLVSMKGRLSAGEAARIRDVVGVSGMGGSAS